MLWSVLFCALKFTLMSRPRSNGKHNSLTNAPWGPINPVRALVKDITVGSAAGWRDTETDPAKFMFVSKLRGRYNFLDVCLQLWNFICYMRRLNLWLFCVLTETMELLPANITCGTPTVFSAARGAGTGLCNTTRASNQLNSVRLER